LIEAIVLAGGLGTRLREVVPDCPKPMAPVAGRPFLEILLESLSSKGIDKIILSVGFRGEAIKRHFGLRFSGMDIEYATENSPLGTGGAIRLAMEFCSGNHVFIFNGDTYLDLDVAQVEDLWCKNGRPIIVAREVPNTSRYGRLRVIDNTVVGFSERGAAGVGIISAGCYVLNRGQLDRFELNRRFSLESDFLPQAAAERLLDLYVTSGHFIDIGVPEDYSRAQIELAKD